MFTICWSERGKRENMKRGKKDILIAGVTILEQS